MDPNRQSYRDLTASSLFCIRCKQAVPVRERLLLILPDGELHEYICKVCAESLGTKKVSRKLPDGIILP